MIVFKPSALMGPVKEDDGVQFQDPYLQSGVPASINLLESLKGDPSLQGAIPKLTASRLSSIAPLAYNGAANHGNLKVVPQKAFRALPAISSRVRYSRSNDRTEKPCTIAALDIEAAPFSKDDIEITKIDMKLPDGSTEDLGKGRAPMLPLLCHPKDNPVCLYRLIPNDSSSQASNPTSARTVLVTIKAIVIVSKTCRPTIEMRWKTGVDFSTALNPIYGAPGQSMQRPSRPSSLSTAPSTSNVNDLPMTTREGDSSSRGRANQTRQRVVSVSDFGLSVTFTAPKTVNVREPFSWDVLVLNRSNKPVQLAFTVITKRKSRVNEGHLPRSFTSSATESKNSDTAEAVIDENFVYARQRNASNEAAQVINLTTDVRIGYV
jgi:hypothetical protein